MLSKNEIKDIQSLYQKKQRDVQGLYIAEGPKLAEELINAGVGIKHIYATNSWIARNNNVAASVREISDIDLSRVSQLQTPNEVVVIAQQQLPQQEPVFKNNFTLVLDGIQDPGNMGTILRTADWFGITQVVCSHDCADVYNPKVVQATMGSIARVGVWQKNWDHWFLPTTCQCMVPCCKATTFTASRGLQKDY